MPWRSEVDLHGAVVVITGAARGIGRAAAEAFAERGARPVLIDVDPAVHEAAGALPGARAVECDITDAAAVRQAFDEVLAELGGVDVLVNNAGISHRSLFADTEVAVVEQVMRVNFLGAVHCTKAALDSLVAREGQVVAVTSVAGFAPLLGRTGYAASKHALHGFFDTLRAELVDEGVGVSLVCPSFVATDLRDTAMRGDGTPVSGPKAEVGRALQPAEVAEAIVDAVRHRRRQVVLSPVGKASWWVSRLWPRLYERIMRRTQRRELG